MSDMSCEQNPLESLWKPGTDEAWPLNTLTRPKIAKKNRASKFVNRCFWTTWKSAIGGFWGAKMVKGLVRQSSYSFYTFGFRNKCSCSYVPLLRLLTVVIINFRSRIDIWDKITQLPARLYWRQYLYLAPKYVWIFISKIFGVRRRVPHSHFFRELACVMPRYSVWILRNASFIGSPIRFTRSNISHEWKRELKLISERYKC